MLAELALAGRPDVSLATVQGHAAALTRVDRKYLVPVPLVRRLLTELSHDWAVLDVAGRRSTHYRTTYFDTADLWTARAHVQGRRRRWKVRSRLYIEDGLCRLEVKTRDGRGQTVKVYAPSSPDSYGKLSLADRDFVTRTLADRAIPVDVAALVPTIEVAYERMTLARTRRDPARLTLDWQVTCDLDGEQVRLDEGHVLVETKGDRRPSEADRLLIGLGARPTSFSKYTAGAALLREDIADNDVRRLRGRVLHVGPGTTPQIRRQTA
ncbi:MAG: VTC domain-containing protein [Marmoricola sp.]